MTPREKAKALLLSKNLKHVVYGWSTDKGDAITEQADEMFEFAADEEYEAFVRTLVENRPTLYTIFAVHAK